MRYDSMPRQSIAQGSTGSQRSSSLNDHSLNLTQSRNDGGLQMKSQTRKFIERISKDQTLQKNNSLLRLSYNPLLDDLLEANEREAEMFAEVTQKKRSVLSRLNSVKENYSKQQRNRHYTIQTEEAPLKSE